MNPGVEYYRPFGLQAYATVRVLRVPTAGDTVTINGDVYTYGTTFFGSTTAQVAEGLVAAINGDRTKYASLASVLVPSRLYFAYYAGDTVVLMASNPGATGNALTLATSAAAAFTVSGATFSGGVDGVLSITIAGLTATSSLPAATALTKRTVTSGSRTMTGSAIPLTAASAKFTKLDFVADGAVTFGTSGTQPFSIVANVWYTYHAPPGCVLDANDLYFNGTGPTAVAYIYAN